MASLGDLCFRWRNNTNVILLDLDEMGERLFNKSLSLVICKCVFESIVDHITTIFSCCVGVVTNLYP